MKVDEWTSEDGHTPGGGEFPPCAGLTSNALPEAQSTVSAESSQTGVSTRSVHILSKSKVQKEEEIPHWYALRTTYGREKKAYDYMTAKGITAFYPTIDTVKLINGKRKVVTESRLPNIFFAHGTEEQKRNAGVFEDTIRISVGIENIEDLKSDFKQAVDSINVNESEE